MSSFTEPLVVKIHQRDARPVELVEGFAYLVGFDPKRAIEVKAGFATDGASVPRPFTAFIRPWGRHGKAAVLHDWLYRWAGWRAVWRTFMPDARNARHAADLVFLEAMAVLHVPLHRRLLIYAAVRAGGWVAWRK